MSLAINPARVIRVLLADDWYNCEEGSFEIGSYEFVEPADTPDGFDFPVFSAGQCDLTPSTGFTFTSTAGYRISGPITAILAVITI